MKSRLLNILVLIQCVIIFSYSISAQERKYFYFVFLNPNPDRIVLPQAEADTLQAHHLANIDSLYREGGLVVAGSFNEGGGIFILQAESEDQATRIVNSDPAVKANRFIIDIYPFTIQKGSICKAADPFELAEYTFIKFSRKGQVCKLEPETLEFLYQQHKAFTDTLSLGNKILIDGTLEPYAGKIMIINTNSAEELKVITSGSPFNSLDDYKMIVKTLNAGKGEFCEQETE